MQILNVGKPGNIDVRQGVTLKGQKLDLVVWNQREPDFRLRVCCMQADTRTLEFVDAGGIPTEANYGGGLYHSTKSNKLYFLSTSKGPSEIGQYELRLSEQGNITGTKVRGWSFKACEGAVADDATGTFYVAEEDHGIWQLPAEPTDPTPPRQILKVGEHGLAADLEGLALAKVEQHSTWLIVSSQGNNSFRVFESRNPFRFVGAFSIAGAVASDGIDLSPRQLGSQFPHGLFACHTDNDGHPILLSDWEQIKQQLASQAKTRLQSGH